MWVFLFNPNIIIIVIVTIITFLLFIAKVLAEFFMTDDFISMTNAKPPLKEILLYIQYSFWE